MTDETGYVDRRTVLTAVPVSLGGVAGCSTVRSQGTVDFVSLLAAGSLAVAFNEQVGPAFEDATGIGYRGEFHGSNAVMRMVLDDQARPDVVVSADASLLRAKLEPTVIRWDVVFASNEVGIAYDPETEVGSRLDGTEPWYDVLRSTDASVARSDPDLDPLGYRTVQLFELAESYYDELGLTDALRSELVIDPGEAHLLAAVETGDRAAAVVYRNMAVDHDLPYQSLPAALNFSDPALADHYASVTYTTEQGTTLDGTPVLYNVTVPRAAPNPAAGRSFVEFLLSRPALLRENGLVVTDAFPRRHGDVPAEVMP